MVGVEGIVRLRDRSLDECVENYRMWVRLGASRVTFNTESPIMWNRLGGNRPDVKNAGMSAAERLDKIAEFKARIAAL